MIHERRRWPSCVFLVFVAVTLGLSTYLGKKAKSSAGYFAAHGQIPWFVNGVAFAGDYLSAASFLGICGMIAFYGYDGFLYSIGYLAGWVVALFVVAEPMKRLGKFTFADALNARFNSPGIKLAAGVSTLAVSVFYLDSADGRRRRAGAAAVGAAALGGRGARGRGGDLHRGDGRHGLDDVGAVHQGLAAGRVQHRADGADSGPRISRRGTSPVERQTVVKQPDGQVLVNGQPRWHATGRNSAAARRLRQPTCRAASQKPARSARSNSSARLQQSEVVLNTSQTVRKTPTAHGHDHILPEADARQPDAAARRASDVQRHPQRELVRQAEFHLADARAVLRHGLAAAHSHSLLHGEGRGGRPQEHDRRHRLHRVLLRAHAVHGPGRDDQRRTRPDRQQHGGAAAGAASASCCSPSSRRSRSRPCWAP